METRVEACQRQFSGTFKRAHIGSSAGAITAYVTLIVSKLMNYPSAGLTWNAVVVVPLAVYALVFAGLLWNYARAMKRSRALDEADYRSFVSARMQS